MVAVLDYLAYKTKARPLGLSFGRAPEASLGSASSGSTEFDVRAAKTPASASKLSKSLLRNFNAFAAHSSDLGKTPTCGLPCPGQVASSRRTTTCWPRR